MSVTLVSETVQLPKEAKEVKDAIVGIVKGLHEGKSVVEIAASELSALATAVDGLNQISDEAKTPQIAVLAGLLGGQIGEVFLTPKPTAAIAQVAEVAEQAKA